MLVLSTGYGLAHGLSLAQAVVLGKALRIEGGNYVVSGRGEETIEQRLNKAMEQQK